MAGIPSRRLRLPGPSQRRRRIDGCHGRKGFWRPYRADRQRAPANLQGAVRLDEQARPCPRRKLRREAWQPCAHPLGQQSGHGRLLAGGHQGRRRGRQHHADAQSRRTDQDRRQGRGQPDALRYSPDGRDDRLRQGQSLPEAGRRLRRDSKPRRRTRPHCARQVCGLRSGTHRS
ncbi:hypothetical protein D9M72_476620 [compost metagenome]